MIVLKIKGGLGNQLFQYATGRALSIKLNTELKLDLTFFDDPKYSMTYRLHRFNLPFTIARKVEYSHLLSYSSRSIFSRLLKKLGIKIYPFYKNSHIIEEAIYKIFNNNLSYDNDYYIEGWLASENYFKDYRNILLKDLDADILLNNENQNLKEIIINTNSVAVHIRRGEYLTNTFFNSIPIIYYRNAIDIISTKIIDPIFYFFSDDIKWVKNEFSNVSNAIFVENNSKFESFYTTVGDIADLMLMRTCKHQIIANSTFSWWGAWLNVNPNKKVYYPALWFNNTRAQKDFEKNDFIPISWNKVEF